jgi:hypothetical protein
LLKGILYLTGKGKRLRENPETADRRKPEFACSTCKLTAKAYKSHGKNRLLGNR